MTQAEADLLTIQAEQELTRKRSEELCTCRHTKQLLIEQYIRATCSKAERSVQVYIDHDDPIVQADLISQLGDYFRSVKFKVKRDYELHSLTLKW